MCICVVLVLAFVSKGWIIYGLPYLEKFPDYECQFSINPTKWVTCDREAICEDRDMNGYSNATG